MSAARPPRRRPSPFWAHPHLGQALALWLVGSGLAWLAARAGIGLGLGTALVTGAAFGLVAARRVDHRRLRVARRKAP
ncbi:MAG TPA: hypothetical protein PK826_10565 [Anaerolineae bacterium]|jgi:hypothetical protein|nr:hypothetical protein [Ardenticatenia bacterium]HQZ71752.1 hypothetical protein [Anaerolineae bacterium]HRA21201.1 hypothetical protein [Anaerolineae bacterium]